MVGRGRGGGEGRRLEVGIGGEEEWKGRKVYCFVGITSRAALGGLEGILVYDVLEAGEPCCWNTVQVEVRPRCRHITSDTGSTRLEDNRDGPKAHGRGLPGDCHRILMHHVISCSACEYTGLCAVAEKELEKQSLERKSST